MINETSQLEHVVVQNGTILNPIHLNVVVMTLRHHFYEASPQQTTQHFSAGPCAL